MEDAIKESVVVRDQARAICGLQTMISNQADTVRSQEGTIGKQVDAIAEQVSTIKRLSTVGGVLLLLLGAAAFTGFEALTHRSVTPDSSVACVQSQALSKAQLEAQKAQLEFQTQIERNTMELRFRVVTACVAHGGAPVFQGGNIDCRK